MAGHSERQRSLTLRVPTDAAAADSVSDTEVHITDQVSQKRYDLTLYRMFLILVLLATILLTCMHMRGQLLEAKWRTSFNGALATKAIATSPVEVLEVRNSQNVAFSFVWGLLVAMQLVVLVKIIYAVCRQSEKATTARNEKEGLACLWSNLTTRLPFVRRIFDATTALSVRGDRFWHKIAFMLVTDVVFQVEVLSVYGGSSLLTWSPRSPVQDPPVILVHASLLALDIMLQPLFYFLDLRIFAEITEAMTDIGFTMDRLLVVRSSEESDSFRFDPMKWYIFRQTGVVDLLVTAWPIIGLSLGISALEDEVARRAAAGGGASAPEVREEDGAPTTPRSTAISEDRESGGASSLDRPQCPQDTVLADVSFVLTVAPSVVMASQTDELVVGSAFGATTQCDDKNTNEVAVPEGGEVEGTQVQADHPRVPRNTVAIALGKDLPFLCLGLLLLGFVVHQQLQTDCIAAGYTDCNWIVHPLWSFPACDCHIVSVHLFHNATQECITNPETRRLRGRPRALYANLEHVPLHLQECAMNDDEFVAMLHHLPFLRSVNANHQAIALSDPTRLPVMKDLTYLDLFHCAGVQHLSAELGVKFPKLEFLHLTFASVSSLDADLLDNWDIEMIDVYGNPVCEEGSAEFQAIQNKHPGRLTCNATWETDEWSTLKQELDTNYCGRGNPESDRLHRLMVSMAIECRAYLEEPHHECLPQCKTASPFIYALDTDGDGYINITEGAEMVTAYGGRNWDDEAEMACMLEATGCLQPWEQRDKVRQDPCRPPTRPTAVFGSDSDCAFTQSEVGPNNAHWKRRHRRRCRF